MELKNKNDTSTPFSILPLGGVREIGRNSFAIECADELLLVDAGVIFPSEDQYGVDLILPNFEYILERKNKLKGIILTHGHEDHIGALPYLFSEINAPMYTTKLTSGLISNKCAEFSSRGKLVFNQIKPGDEFKVGEAFQISTALLNHSIPDGIGLRIKTPGGTLVHSGDFKLDQTPLNDERTDLSRFCKWGDEGVDLMTIDVTNVYRRGHTPSERRIGLVFERLFEIAPGRIFIAMFSSHFHRMQQAVDVASRMGRRIVILGRSMVMNFKTAMEMHYLDVPKGMIVEADDMGMYKDRELLIFATGSQGEPLSVLSRMSAGGYHVTIRKDDTVIVSANPIPGNEAAVGRIINRLYEMGANVITSEQEEVHVSGHASREEIKILYNCVKPKFIMPFHGESRHFIEFKNLMIKMGRSASDVILTQPGDKVNLRGDEIKVQEGVTGGELQVRGDVVEDEYGHLAKQRTSMATGGVLVAVVYLDKRRQKVSKVDFQTRGFINPKDWSHIFTRAEKSVLDSVNTIHFDEMKDHGNLIEKTESKLSRLILRETGLRPLIIVSVVEA